MKNCAFLLLFALLPVAGITVYDADLASPDGTYPGWYNGTGNPNGGFTISLENGIELGLRVKLRQDPNVIHSVDNVYDVPTGPQLTNPARAAWNYEFSIDLQPSGIGTLTLGDILAVLTITNVTSGAVASVSPLSYWTDNSGFGSTGETTGLSAAQWGAQNSQNPIFPDFPLAYEYDMDAPRLYRFDLAVTDLAGQPLGSNTVFANVVAPVPEPATIALAGLGFAMLAVASARRRGGRELALQLRRDLRRRLARLLDRA